MWRMAGYTDGLSATRLILMDHRGHGRSDRPAGVEAHRIDRYVGDVVSVLDAAGAERVVFAGYSDGANVGYAFAARHPERLAGVIGIGAVGGGDEPMSQRADDASQVRDGGMGELMQALREQEADIPDWFALELEGLSTWGGPWSEFSRIDAPTLIIAGELEEGASGIAARHASEAAALMPNGRSVVLPGLGHVAAFVRSDLVLPHIASFVRELA